MYSCGHGRLGRATANCYSARCRGSNEQRRNLPHYQKDHRILFLTYATWHRWNPRKSRWIGLRLCRRANGRKYSLGAAVVMPHHVHVSCMPLMDENSSILIPEITRSIKSDSARRINEALAERVGFGRMSLSTAFSAARRASGERSCTSCRTPCAQALGTNSRTVSMVVGG
jgi:hypothetical protein